MKKYLILILIVLFMTINVWAEENAMFLINCNNKVPKGSNITCDVEVSYNEFEFSTLEFRLDSNLDIVFENSVGNLNKVDNNYKLSFDKKLAPLSKIGVIKINNVDESKITVSNVKFIEDEKIVYQIQDFLKTISIVKENLDGNCDLNGIIVNGVPVKDFDKDKLLYDPVYVDNQSVFIDAIKSSAKASMMGLGSMRVREGRDVTRVITVIAENGNKKEYTLVLRNDVEKVTIKNEEILPDALSSDARLNLIEIHENGEKIKLDFRKEQTTYVIDLKDNNTSSLLVEAELSDSKATFVDGFGPRNVNLDYGLNKIEIKVLAEDQTENVYTINVTREDKRDNISLLSSLTINDKKVELNDNVFEYLIALDSEITRTNVVLEPKSDKATVEYEDMDLLDEENLLIIKVTAENGHQSEYKIKIKKISEDTKVDFENITINNYSIKFDKDTFEYDLYFDVIPSNLDISVNPTGVIHEIADNENLKNGSVVTIKVIDNGTTRNYAFNIHDKSLVSNNIIIYYAFFGFGVVLLIASIIYSIKINKKDFTK